MTIVHICLCDPYAENWSYHRNILSEQNAHDGNDTYIVTSEYQMDTDGNHGGKGDNMYTNSFGVHVIRLADVFPYSKRVSSKMNTVRGITRTLEEINPDIIMVHNQQTFNMYDITRYKRKHPKVVLLADSHASFANSCRTKFSKWIVQGIIFRHVIRKNYRYLDGMYYIGLGELEFFRKEYGIYEDNNSILPLPARFIGIKDKEENRKLVRQELGVKNNELLFVHSGKMSKEKRTKELLECLKEFNNANFKLVIIGSIPDTNKELYDLIESDERFVYLGWKTSTELSRVISAADLYLQPGSVSVTMNNALAVGTPIMIFPHNVYKQFFEGWEILAANNEEMTNGFKKIFENPELLKEKIPMAYATAKRYFDCSVFAREMYSYVEGGSEKELFRYKDGIRYVSLL